MKKKRIDFARGSNRKAQVTIFIIVALVVFFVFLFMILLANQVKKDQLTQERENIFTKSFRKEALRIYLDDCLKDELEKGLILLGEQGRLWEGQIGGTKTFSSGENGIEFSQGGKVFNVFYGISDEKSGDAYPCNRKSRPESELELDGGEGGRGGPENAEGPAAENLEYCQYQYPNTTVGFGNLNLRASTLTTDLRRYLIESVEVCVGEYVSEKISDQVEVEKTELKMTVDIRDEGIAVSAEYPLKLILGKEEFFQLSQFDFFYPTQFKKLLDAAIIFPLRMDQKYVDFEYTEKTLKSPFFEYGNTEKFRDCSLKPGTNYFTCKLSLFDEKYKALSVVLKDSTPETSDDQSVFELENGDDVFVFTSPQVIQGEDYVFRIARQNRPPALDYINRSQCLDGDDSYDYLVIQGDTDESENEDLDGDGIVNEKGFGEIEFTLRARDPDEDIEGIEDITYVVNGQPAEIDNDQKLIDPIPNLNPGINTLFVVAFDKHGKEDKQDVRILMDRPIDIGVSVDLPYTFLDGGGNPIPYDHKYGPDGGLFVVSKEDPVFVSVTIPEGSAVNVNPVMTLGYFDVINGFEEKYLISQNLVDEGEGEQWFSFPDLRQPPRDLDAYKIVFESWDSIQSAFNPFAEATDEAKLEISFNSNYCGAVDKNKFTSVDVKVMPCVPHRNKERPFASPYDNYKYENYNFDDEDLAQTSEFSGITDHLDNPFEATHSCCKITGVNVWGYAPADEPCFVNPLPGCYAGLMDIYGVDIYGDPLEGGLTRFVLQEEVVLCGDKNGVVSSGNKCEGDHANKLVNDRLTCGRDGSPECAVNEIEHVCKDGPAFQFIDGEGWCSGKMGCDEIYSGVISYTGDDPPDTDEINRIATEYFMTNLGDPWDKIQQLGFRLGCPSCRDSGSDCGGDLDEKTNVKCTEDLSFNFNKVCTVGRECVEP